MNVLGFEIKRPPKEDKPKADPKVAVLEQIKKGAAEYVKNIQGKHFLLFYQAEKEVKFFKTNWFEARHFVHFCGILPCDCSAEELLTKAVLGTLTVKDFVFLDEKITPKRAANLPSIFNFFTAQREIVELDNFSFLLADKKAENKVTDCLFTVLDNDYELVKLADLKSKSTQKRKGKPIILTLEFISESGNGENKKFNSISFHDENISFSELKLSANILEILPNSVKRKLGISYSTKFSKDNFYIERKFKFNDDEVNGITGADYFIVVAGDDAQNYPLYGAGITEKIADDWDIPTQLALEIYEEAQNQRSPISHENNENKNEKNEEEN